MTSNGYVGRYAEYIFALSEKRVVGLNSWSLFIVFFLFLCLRAPSSSSAFAARTIATNFFFCAIIALFAQIGADIAS
jgi:hypothetical protein